LPKKNGQEVIIVSEKKVSDKELDQVSGGGSIGRRHCDAVSTWEFEFWLVKPRFLDEEFCRMYEFNGRGLQETYCCEECKHYYSE